jgi:hypothetical protein
MTERGLDDQHAAHGDRTRRINTALITVASAVAVTAVIAVPLVLARGNDGAGPGPSYPTGAPTPSASPAPNPDPSPTTGPSADVGGPWLTSIPARFPLAAGYPETNGDGTSVKVNRVGGSLPLQLCGSEVATDAGLRDAAQAAYSAPEDSRSRDLVLYQGSEAAAQALATVRTSVAGCAEETVGATDQVREEYPYDAGDESFAWTERYRTDGAIGTGLTDYHVVRVGNALLLVTTYDGTARSGDSAAQVGRAEARDAAPVVQAMQLFAERP